MNVTKMSHAMLSFALSDAGLTGESKKTEFAFNRGDKGAARAFIAAVGDVNRAIAILKALK